MLISDFFGFVEVILGLVHASYSLPEGQAVKLSLHLEGSSGSWKSGKGFFFDFQFLGNDCPSWECVNLTWVSSNKDLDGKKTASEEQ